MSSADEEAIRLIAAESLEAEAKQLKAGVENILIEIARLRIRQTAERLELLAKSLRGELR